MACGRHVFILLAIMNKASSVCQKLLSAVDKMVRHCHTGQVAQLVGRSPVHQNVVGPIPGQGMYRRQPVEVSHIDVSLCLSVSLKSIKTFPWVRI